MRRKLCTWPIMALVTPLTNWHCQCLCQNHIDAQNHLTLQGLCSSCAVLKFLERALPCCRDVQMLGNTVFKYISDFSSYAREQQTDLQAIQCAYEAANQAAQADQLPCLVLCQTPPAVRRHDRYTVTTRPCGYGACVSSEKVRMGSSCDLISAMLAATS